MVRDPNPDTPYDLVRLLIDNRRSPTSTVGWYRPGHPWRLPGIPPGGHSRSGSESRVLAAAGVFVKLAPFVLVAAALIALLAVPVRPRWREARWLTFAFVAALLAFHAASLALWGDGYLASYAFHMERGIQIESTWAG